MDSLRFFLILICLNTSYAHQYYDNSNCLSEQSYPGSRYTCNSTSQDSCKTFVVYRANHDFDTISKISDLLNVTTNALLHLNNLTSSSEDLGYGREVLVPIDCSCSGKFFRANLSYTASEIMSLSHVGCDVFEGLVKLLALSEENPGGRKIVEAGSTLRVPLNCACPDDSSGDKAIKYLVTYPFVEGDVLALLSKKFGISDEDLWKVNSLDPKSSIYPNTTILVPLRGEPAINLDAPGSPPPIISFYETTSVEKPTESIKPRNYFIAGSIICFSLALVVLIARFLCVKALKKPKGKKYFSFTETSSPILSPAKGSARSSFCLSPDVLVGIKFSLQNYTAEAIKTATKDFSEESKMMVGRQVYKGVIKNVKVMIKETSLEGARRVIDIHSKINHINIVKLLGVCYGDNINELSWSYLVFEYPGNGCLRDCLSNFSSPLRWSQRVQIALDIVTALRYLHCCIFPSYAHMNIHSQNVYVTSSFRAKLGEIGSKSIGEAASEKDDIFAFGIVLLELISGRDQDKEGKLSKESVGFLGGRVSIEGGCFDQLRSFVDRSLGEDYSLAEALCLAVLAVACLEDDSLNRPSMDDIIKVLSRMVVSG